MAKSDKNLKYKNVAISGLPGAGSTTLGRLLAEELKWEHFSGGDFMRQYAIEQGVFDPENKAHHDATVYDDDFDRKVDYGMREGMKEEEGKIYDSWLSGFLAQGIESTLKILMICSEDMVRVDRLANRDDITIAQAKRHIFEREQKNLKKWQRMYKDEWKKWVVDEGTLPESAEIYFWRPELYDLVIDSFRLSKEEVLKVALNVLREGV